MRRGSALSVFIDRYMLSVDPDMSETVAYNRVALTDYFQHRNVEKLYLNERQLHSSWSLR